MLRKLGYGIFVGILVFLAYQSVNYHRQAIQDDIDRRVTTALSREYFEGMGIVVDGRDIVLRGEVSTEEEKEAVEAKAAAVDGVRVVRNELVLKKPVQLEQIQAEEEKAQPASTYEFIVKVSKDYVVISKYLPDETIRAKLFDTLHQNYPDRKIIDDTLVLPGVSRDFNTALSVVMGYIGYFDELVLRLTDTTLQINGMPRSSDIEERIEYAISSKIPSGYLYTFDIRPPEIMPAAGPELEGFSISDLEDRLTLEVQNKTCEETLKHMVFSRAVLFESGSANIDRRSLGLLNNVAILARRCPNFKIVVEGYTGHGGKESVSDELNHQRALELVDYLTALGAPEDIRITGIGDEGAEDAEKRPIEFKLMPTQQQEEIL